MKRLALTLTLGVLSLLTAACAKHHRPAPPLVNPHRPAQTTPDSKTSSPTPVVPVDTWTSLNVTSPDGETLSRDELYTGSASYPCTTSDILIIQKVNGTVIDDVAAMKADVTKDKGKPSKDELADAALRIGNAIYFCNQLRATIDLKTCKDPKMLLDVNNVGTNCDRLPDLKGSIEAVTRL